MVVAQAAGVASAARLPAPAQAVGEMMSESFDAAAPLDPARLPARLMTSADAKARRFYRTTDPRAGTRRCCACGQTKPLAAFHRDRWTGLGRMHECAACRNDRNTSARREAAGRSEEQ